MGLRGIYTPQGGIVYRVENTDFEILTVRHAAANTALGKEKSPYGRISLVAPIFFTVFGPNGIQGHFQGLKTRGPLPPQSELS